MVLCVTGCMAAGKNAASDILEKHGFVAIDADKVVHEILRGKTFQEKVIFTFAPFAEKSGIVLRNCDGTLNRRNLGKLIFADKKLLEIQESIVFPEVDRKIEEFIESGMKSGKDVVVNATVLYKIPSVKKCDAVIFVDAPVLTRLFRARKRDGMKTVQILQRFWSQKNLFSKYKKSNADTFKVNNTGDLTALEEKLMKKIGELKNEK
ncbi:MAG: dephospho-CoA kinase [Treponema sp.]|nr:dephospho-CoA kinase [Treponema sp.]